MPEHAMEETAAAVKRPMLSPEPAPHAHVPAPGAVWDAGGARVPGAPFAVLAIQRAAGNQAVMRMLDARRPGHPLSGPSTAVQRLSEDELDDDVQAIREDELDDDVQRDTAALHEPSDEAIRSAAAEGVRTPSTTLPHLDRIQASFGRHYIGHIQAHFGEEAARASQAMNALAYASGDHVVFGTTPDLRTAAHEAAHVVQQQAGVQLFGGIGRPGDPYEQHADAVADAVVAGRSAEGLIKPFTLTTQVLAANTTHSGVPPMRYSLVQRNGDDEKKKKKENEQHAKTRLANARNRNKDKRSTGSTNLNRDSKKIVKYQKELNYVDSAKFKIGGTGGRFRPGLGRQPYLSLEAAQFSDPLIKSNYDDIIKHFKGNDAGEARKILDVIESDADAGTDVVGQARAFIVALTQIAEAHKSRIPGADKLARALLRRIAAGELTFERAFNRKKGLFVPAWSKTAGARRGGQVAGRVLFSMLAKASDNYSAEKLAQDIGSEDFEELIATVLEDLSESSTSNHDDRMLDLDEDGVLQGGLDDGNKSEEEWFPQMGLSILIGKDENEWMSQESSSPWVGEDESDWISQEDLAILIGKDENKWMSQEGSSIRIGEDKDDWMQDYLEDRMSEIEIKIENQSESEHENENYADRMLQDRLREHGRQLEKVSGDGNCFYSAITRQLQILSGIEPESYDLRASITQLIGENIEDFELFALNNDLNEVADQILTNFSWNNEGGDLAPQLIASVLQRDIHIVSPGGVRTFSQIQDLERTAHLPAGIEGGEPLILAYNGVNHYDSTSAIEGPPPRPRGQ